MKKNIVAPVALAAAGLLLLSACATGAEEAAPVAEETAATETPKPLRSFPAPSYSMVPAPLVPSLKQLQSSSWRSTPVLP